MRDESKQNNIIIMENVSYTKCLTHVCIWILNLNAFAFFFIINNIIIIISINSSIVKAETRFRFRRKHVWYIKSVFCIPKIEYIELKFLLKYVYFLFLQSLMLNLFNALWNIMSHFDKLKSYDDDETFSLIIIPSAC